jgi:hypothetical protein
MQGHAHRCAAPPPPCGIKVYCLTSNCTETLVQHCTAVLFCTDNLYQVDLLYDTSFYGLL